MCTISMVGDGWRDQFPRRWPSVVPYVTRHTPPEISREEFDALKREVQELRELLLAAKKFDAATGQAGCEADEKVALIKAVAKMVGVDLADVFGP